MTWRDRTELALGNLWRMKLRATLTISGVVIAIAALVAMLSFGAGNQQYVTDQFHQLGLFTTVYVYPPDEDETPDSLEVPPLDDQAIAVLGTIPGVNLAYPLDAFPITVTLGDSSVSSQGRALISNAAQTRLFSQLTAGAAFSCDSCYQAVIPGRLLDSFGIDNPDSILGKFIEITVELSTLDSGLVSVFRDRDGTLSQRLKNIEFDSLSSQDYFQRVTRREVADAISRFFDGFMQAPLIVRDSFEVVGVSRGSGGGRSVRSVLIPAARAVAMTSGGVVMDPTTVLASFRGGKVNILGGSQEDSREYPRVTLDIDPAVPYQQIKDSVEAVGYRTFSYAEQFEEMQRLFVYFDMALAMIGLVALITASLGIVNTMVMSIIERRREIGVLRSLGADSRDIKMLFLAESGVIGFLGGIGGVALGWLVSRVASMIAKAFMAHEELEQIELFAMPLWLIALALVFSLGVSLVAGLYPAARAASVDPVEALRNE